MHYIPKTEEDDTASKTSSRGRKSRRSNGSRKSSSSRQRRKTKPAESTPPAKSAQAHQKAAKKLRNLITRSFAKQKPAPMSNSEQDALLTVIHCPVRQQTKEDLIRRDSQNSFSLGSYYSTTSTTPTNSQAQSHRKKLRQSVANGEVSPRDAPSSTAHMNDDSFTDDDEDASLLTDPALETPQEREKRIQRAQDKIRQAMSFPLWQCLLAIAIYVVLSVICFSFLLEQDWTLLDSSYFAVATFTTIGYGDVVPDTLYARLFTCVWALSGVACLGVALGVLGSNLIVVHEQQMEKAQGQRQSNVIGLFDHYADDEHDSLHGDSHQALGYSTIEEGRQRVMFDHFVDSDDETNPRAKPARESCWKHCGISAGLIRGILLSGYITGVLYLIAQQEGWNLPMTIYYGVITASTVGYGDFCPSTKMGRFLAILFIPVAVGIMGCFLEAVANAIIDYRRERYATKLHNEPLTMQQIRILDSDGDGEVSRAEFLEFMLVAMNQVDKDLLDRLKEHFHRLDADGSGTINKADLAEMAKQRLTQDVTNKLLLSQYKDNLVRQAHSNSPSSSAGAGSGVVRPVLERRTTDQTSNRTYGTA